MKKNIETASSNTKHFQEKLDDYEGLTQFDRASLIEVLQEHGTSIETIQSNIINLTKQIHKLKQSEKFLRHAHNLHLENCKKYHKRIADIDLEHIEDLAEQDDPIKVAVLDDEGKTIRVEANSHGYQSVCQRVKETNEHREKIINYVKKLIS